MDIHICTDKKDWDAWFFSQNSREFLQSWDWGVFQEHAGKEPLRLQAVDQGRIAGQMQGFLYQLGAGVSYLYVPRPVRMETGVYEAFFSFIKKKSISFARIEPAEIMPDTAFSIRPVRHRQPADTLFLDISVSEEELLQAMHAKTRYNIRVAERKGITVRQEKDADIFWRLNKETSVRDAFKTHGRDYYARMLELDSVFQSTAYYEGDAIASNIFIRFGDRYTYLHGASGNRHRNLMAPYMLQWEAIRHAKALGCIEYDFWGIAPPVSEEGDAKKTCFHTLCWKVDHPWTGITRFKAGFGGKAYAYPPSVDVLFDLWRYRLYRLVRRIKGV